MYVCAEDACWYEQQPTKWHWTSNSGVTGGGCEPPCMWVLGIQTKSSEGATGASFLSKPISSLLSYIVLIINTIFSSDTLFRCALSYHFILLIIFQRSLK